MTLHACTDCIFTVNPLNNQLCSECSRHEGKHACGLDVTYCDKCSIELEVGRIGNCSSCMDRMCHEIDQ